MVQFVATLANYEYAFSWSFKTVSLPVSAWIQKASSQSTDLVQPFTLCLDAPCLSGDTISMQALAVQGQAYIACAYSRSLEANNLSARC